MGIPVFIYIYTVSKYSKLDVTNALTTAKEISIETPARHKPTTTKTFVATLFSMHISKNRLLGKPGAIKQGETVINPMKIQ